MEAFTKPTRVSARADDILKQKIEKPNMPGAEGAEHEYIVALKPDAPFEYLTLCGINFAKKVYSVEAALSRNRHKRFDSKMITRLMTEEQATYLLDRANQVVRRINKNGVDRVVSYAEMIILQKKTEFLQETERGRLVRRLEDMETSGDLSVEYLQDMLDKKKQEQKRIEAKQKSKKPRKKPTKKKQSEVVADGDN